MTSALLEKLLTLGRKITEVAQKGGNGITLDNAFMHPDVLGMREDLIKVLDAADTASALIEATAQLHLEAEKLFEKPTLTVDELVKLGAITAAARALSIQAFRAAGAPLQMFVYTLRQILPALEALAKVGVLVVSAVL